VEPTRTPSPEHVEFDVLCAEVEDFEPLPAIKSDVLERDRDDVDTIALDDQILAGLVSPV
jgi:hypothetical protein